MLKRLESLVGVISNDIIEGGVIFIELDSITFDEVKQEVENKVGHFIETKKVKDMGKCITLSYAGKNFIITYNNEMKEKTDTMFIAFKTKIDGEKKEVIVGEDEKFV